MFYYISGKTAHIGPDFAVIDAGGVGYKIYTSESTLKRVEIDRPAKLYTYLNVREDLMDLYGFLTAEELGAFHHPAVGIRSGGGDRKYQGDHPRAGRWAEGSTENRFGTEG